MPCWKRRGVPNGQSSRSRVQNLQEASPWLRLRFAAQGLQGESRCHDDRGHQWSRVVPQRALEHVRAQAQRAREARQASALERAAHRVPGSPRLENGLEHRPHGEAPRREVQVERATNRIAARAQSHQQLVAESAQEAKGLSELSLGVIEGNQHGKEEATQEGRRWRHQAPPQERKAATSGSGQGSGAQASAAQVSKGGRQRAQEAPQAKEGESQVLGQAS